MRRLDASATMEKRLFACTRDKSRRNQRLGRGSSRQGRHKKQSLPVQRACRDCAGVADRWGPPERPWPGEGALGKNVVQEALNRCPRPGSR